MGWKLDAHQQNVYQISAKSKGPRSLSKQIKKPCASQSCFRFDDFKFLSKNLCLLRLLLNYFNSLEITFIPSTRPGPLLFRFGDLSRTLQLMANWPTQRQASQHFSRLATFRNRNHWTCNTPIDLSHRNPAALKLHFPKLVLTCYPT